MQKKSSLNMNTWISMKKQIIDMVVCKDLLSFISEFNFSI